MDKFFEFFTRSHILSEDEFNKIKEKCEFEIIKDENNGIKLIVNFYNLIEPELYFLFLSRKNKSNVGMEIVFNFDSVIYSYEDVHPYLMHYVKHSIDNSFNFKNCIERKAGKVEGNVLYIYYLNNIERDDIAKKTKDIETFLANSGIKVQEIKLLLDEKTKEIELYKTDRIAKGMVDLNTAKRNKEESKKVNVTPKPIDGKVEKIIDLIPEQRQAIIIGKVFKTDKLEVKNGEMTIYKFYVTDYSDSILVKCFPSNRTGGVTQAFLEGITEGTWIKVKMSINIDSFEKNDLTGLANNIQIVDEPKEFAVHDNEPKKRIELINHSIMSAFEGVIQPKDQIKLMKKIGHKVYAITDKFDCQIFPEVQSLCKKNEIDTIYGFQSIVFDELIPIVKNPNDEPINGRCVVFDLETTGLYPACDDIIEFGAIKYDNHEIVEKKQFFMKPSKPISHKITEITRINDELVKDGLSEEEGIDEIVKFFGDYPLIAHNGIAFDINFINRKLEKLGRPTLTNPLVDTMQVSRAINDASSHSLGTLCKKYKIEYNGLIAHRADFDAKVLLEVWRKMIYELEPYNIKTFNELNTVLNNKQLATKNRGFLATIYAKQSDSVKPIYKLISRSLTDNFSGKATLYWKDINELRDKLLICNSPSEGDIIYSALYETEAELIERINKYDFIAVSPVSTWDHEINRENITAKDLEEGIKRIIEVSERCQKLVIASSDTYYLRKENEAAYDVYVHTKSIGGKPHRIFSYGESNDVLPKYYYRTTTEMLEEFKFLGKDKAYEIVVDNTYTISDLIEKNIKVLKLDKLYTPTIENAKENLEKMTYDRMYEIYGPNPDQSIIARINRELESIVGHGYSVIYWFSHLLVKQSNNNGYIVGSRGSVGSSLVATMMKITDVNPLPAHYLCDKCKYFYYVDNVNSGFDLPTLKCEKCGGNLVGDGHNIPFETFMGFKGDKVPDIDLNFSAEYQAKAHAFIMETFGYSHTLKAGTIGTVAEKTAFGYVKNYFEMKQKYNVKNAEVLRLAKACEEVKRTTGQHPGGIIVVPKEYDPEDFTPYNFPADDTSLDWHTTHYAFEYLHDSLLKFDILGHDSPTVLRMLENITGINSNIIPNNDEKVMQMFYDINAIGISPERLFNNTVGTNGLPEFGTDFVKEMLKIAVPKTFSDLIRISGLSHGTNVWIGNAKDLIEKNNINISEVISCRDDIMVYLISKGLQNIDAFTIMESVRKGKGLSEDHMKKMRENNVPEWYINSCNKIKYLFPKAHATAYVSMAWKIAWFKLYYPLAFYASYFSIRISVFDLSTIVQGKEKIIYILDNIKSRLAKPDTKYLVKNKEIDLIPIYEMVVELIERGFAIKNVDINLSQIKDFIIVDDKYLIPPFSVIDGLGEAVAESIVEARTEKKFSSIEDLQKRTKISKTHLKYMVENGILDEIPANDQSSLFGDL